MITNSSRQNSNSEEIVNFIEVFATLITIFLAPVLAECLVAGILVFSLSFARLPSHIVIWAAPVITYFVQSLVIVKVAGRSKEHFASCLLGLALTLPLHKFLPGVIQFGGSGQSNIQTAVLIIYVVAILAVLFFARTKHNESFRILVFASMFSISTSFFALLTHFYFVQFFTGEGTRPDIYTRLIPTVLITILLIGMWLYSLAKGNQQ